MDSVSNSPAYHVTDTIGPRSVPLLFCQNGNDKCIHNIRASDIVNAVNLVCNMLPQGILHLSLPREAKAAQKYHDVATETQSRQSCEIRTFGVRFHSIYCIVSEACEQSPKR